MAKRILLIVLIALMALVFVAAVSGDDEETGSEWRLLAQLGRLLAILGRLF